MFRNLIEWFKRLFGIASIRETETQQGQEAAFASAYEDITDINVVAIIAGKLANIVCADATIAVTDGRTEDAVANGNPRSEYLNDSLQRFVTRLKTATARTLGQGGVIVKPYVYNGKIYTDILPQTRYFVIEQAGEVVTRAGFVAAQIVQDDSVYTRYEYHALEPNGTYTIENKATKDDIPVALTSVPAWAELQPKIVIRNVTQMLFGSIICPADSRRDMGSVYGVPVTYGQDKLIQMAVDLINEVPDEYKNKKAFIGADEVLFQTGINGKARLPDSGMYKLFRSGGKIDDKSFWEIFSPEIRHTAYFEGIDYVFGLIEKAIGVNAGVLTNLNTKDATATEIRRSTADTFMLVDGVRRNIETAVNQLVYAYDVIANAFNLAPQGEYEIEFDWSYELLEDSKESFEQIERTVAAGGLGVEHQTAYVLDLPVDEAVKYVPKMEEMME